MKRFVTRKIIKVPRYKLLYILTFISLIFLFLIHFILKIGFKHIEQDKFLNIFIGNTYSNLLPNYNFYNNKKDLFYKNIYGFYLEKDKKVWNEENNLNELIIEGNPLIYIYNTFQTDKYQHSYYNSYNINPVVTQASFILQEYLKNKGIISIVEANSVAKVLKENNISYSLSYRGSRILMERAKNANASLEYFIDLGMADDKYEITTTKINNEYYARVLFIVGAENANYLENQKFANFMHQELEKKYPNLSRGVTLRGGVGYHGVYNQDFSNNAILIHVGGKENKMAEVNRTLKVLADVLYEYIGVTYEKE